MSESGFCPKCGTELTSNSPHGLCPNCLLALGLGAPAAPAAPRRRALIAVAVAVGMGLAASLFTLATIRRPGTEPRAVHFNLYPPGGAEFSERSGDFALAPDARSLVYVASGRDGMGRLWIHRMDSFADRELANTDSASAPFWSPDSRFIAFLADRKLKRIAAAGGAPETLADGRGARGGAWNNDGWIVLAPPRRRVWKPKPRERRDSRGHGGLRFATKNRGAARARTMWVLLPAAKK